MVFEMGEHPDTYWGVQLDDLPKSDLYPTPLMPKIETQERYFKDSIAISLSCEESGTEIRYTLDGSDPTGKSILYKTPFQLKKSATLKARSYAKDSYPSFPASAEFTKLELRKSFKKDNLQPGLQSSYFEGYCVKLADMKQYHIISTSILSKFDVTAIKDYRSFGYYFKGYVKVPETGTYTFYLNSNDGSNLMIDGKMELTNDGFHRAQEKVCKVLLEKGYHTISVDYFQMGGAKALTVSWSFENGKKEEISSEILFHEITMRNIHTNRK